MIADSVYLIFLFLLIAVFVAVFAIFVGITGKGREIAAKDVLSSILKKSVREHIDSKFIVLAALFAMCMVASIVLIPLALVYREALLGGVSYIIFAAVAVFLFITSISLIFVWRGRIE